MCLREDVSMGAVTVRRLEQRPMPRLRQPFPQLDLLTGHPQPEDPKTVRGKKKRTMTCQLLQDEVLCAIPMVAPYCSLGGRGVSVFCLAFTGILMDQLYRS